MVENVDPLRKNIPDTNLQKEGQLVPAAGTAAACQILENGPTV
jgi:hypothetical protein